MFTSTIRSHSSTFNASRGDNGITPALLMMTSSGPKAASAFATKAATSARSVTSSAIASALPPAA
jgi:hypothetical protein